MKDISEKALNLMKNEYISEANMVKTDLCFRKIVPVTAWKTV